MKLKYFVIFLVFISVLTFINTKHKQKIDSLTNDKYLTTSKNIKKYITQLIIEKKQQGLTLALALSKNKNYIDFFRDTNINIELKSLSKSLKKYTNQENVWIHFVSKDGISLYRSWAKKKGDNVAKIRKELPKILKDKKPVNIISVGIFDLSFKSIVPVYDDKEFLGIVEVITKVNSISDNLKSLNHEPIVLVDKKYKKQLRKPFTKKFVDDYYVANLNASEKYLKYVVGKSEEFINNDKFFIRDNNLIVTYKINDMFNENMAYVVIFEDINNINTKDIDNFDKFLKAVAIFVLLIVIATLISIYYYNRSKYTKRLEKSINERTKEIVELKDYHKALFDKNPNIVFVAASDFGIVETNESFFEFFSEYKDIEDFNSKNNCLCQFAIKIEDETYIDSNKEWSEQITKPNRKLCINKDGQIHYFRLEAEQLEHKQHDKIYLITLSDITELISTQMELEKKKEIIYQQSKLADMGQMIGNIAHQWRQPLSFISTSASAIQLKKEHNLLDDQYLDKTLQEIENSAQYLSKTIDTFRDFLKEDKTLKSVVLQDSINKAIQIVESSFKNNYIELINNLNDVEDININLVKGELSQVIINILNNSKDAIKEKKQKDAWVKIDLEKGDKIVNIIIEDNAGGISDNIINRVFEPYFTTKHESQGTGLGLHMSYKIVTESLNGKLYVKNSNNGAKFYIELPLDN